MAQAHTGLTGAATAIGEQPLKVRLHGRRLLLNACRMQGRVAPAAARALLPGRGQLLTPVAHPWAWRQGGHPRCHGSLGSLGAQVEEKKAIKDARVVHG